jgi:uncharacterized protein (TIGR03435 family)
MRNRNASGKFFAKTAGAIALLFVAALAAPACAQSPPAASTAPVARPTFEVASIKVNNSGSGRHSLSTDLPGGGMRAINVSLAGLMSAAYQILASRILGGPPWFDSEFFDIEATAEDDNSGDENRGRLQSLVADRFKLVMHRETRQLPIYALVLAKPGKLGPQLHLDDGNCDSSKPWPAPASSSSVGSASSVSCGSTAEGGTRAGTHAAGRNISMQRFLIALAGPSGDPHVDRPIVDHTGLSGPIDFTLDFAPTWAANTDAADQSSLPSFFTALHEQLGLELKSETGPVDVIVIDHVEQPSEN